MSLRTSTFTKNILLLFFLLFDLLLSSLIDHSPTLLTIALLTAVQILLRLLSLFSLFMLMAQSFVFKYGMIKILCRDAAPAMAMFAISTVFTIVIRVIRILRINGSGMNVSNMWSSDYLVLFIIHNVLSCGWIITMMKASFDMGNTKFYRLEEWIDK